MPPNDNERKSRRRSPQVMTESNDVTPSSGLVRAPKPGARKEDWIAEQLRRVYDEALDEEIPDEMMQLLARLDDGGDDGHGGEERS